jgi:hypothetical protein
LSKVELSSVHEGSLAREAEIYDELPQGKLYHKQHVATNTSFC